ncbi:osmc/ohr family protein [hydrocarbon metagenome]|uniref:Osmc/ohr family protein n=1 Tax=hydrocarbon metagenome TaxID=938273 RepID=A0A0W8FYV3_9ZZZZ
MDNVHYYNTTVKWTEGRKGELLETTMPTIEVATPPEFPKGVPNTWTPEHLYVASANICLMTTFLAIAENSKLNFKSFECDGVGKLEKVDGRFMISEIVLKPKVIVTEEKDIERAERIIEKAENHCLISNSMKTKIKLEIEVSL